MATTREHALNSARRSLVFQAQAMGVTADVLPEELNRRFKAYLARYLDAQGDERQEIGVLLVELLDPDRQIDLAMIQLQEWGAGEPEVEKLETRKLQFGRNLTRRMQERGMKAKDLAEKLNVSASCISQFASGKHKPQSSTLHRLAKALRCEVTDLWPD